MTLKTSRADGRDCGSMLKQCSTRSAISCGHSTGTCIAQIPFARLHASTDGTQRQAQYLGSISQSMICDWQCFMPAQADVACAHAGQANVAGMHIRVKGPLDKGGDMHAQRNSRQPRCHTLMGRSLPLMGGVAVTSSHNRTPKL